MRSYNLQFATPTAAFPAAIPPYRRNRSRRVPLKAFDPATGADDRRKSHRRLERFFFCANTFLTKEG
jgi:hypothetical protein